jgi:hypothetical protein
MVSATLSSWIAQQAKDGFWYRTTAAYSRSFPRSPRGGEVQPWHLVVSQRTPIAQAVEAIVYVWVLAEPRERRDQAHHLPSISRHVFSR